jgi:hypothetical protein
MRFLRAVALASFVVAGSAQAQGSSAANTGCGTGPAGDTCQNAVDFFYYMAPMLGTAMTGGNTTLAQGGAMGGLRLGFIPKIAIDARVNVVLGNIPGFNPQAGAPSQRAMTTTTGMVPMPAVDVALGVFKGIPLGVSNVGGVDLLASALYVPEVNADEFTLTPDNPLSIGYGIRIGLLQESLVAPGIGFSIINRSMPVSTLSSSTGNFNFSVNKLDLSSTAWRLTVSKSLLLFGLAAGYGQDNYKAAVGGITATNTGVGGGSVTAPALETTMKRTNMFVDLSLNLFILKVVATGGMVSGGDMATFYTFDTPANEKRTYGSVGVRLGF